MVDQIITKQKLVEANANASSWEKYWAGNESENVVTRLNKSYPTHAKALRILMENGGIQPFSTEVELLTYVPDVEPTAAKALDTKKVWVWKNGVWSNTGLSELDLAKDYAVSATKGVNICDLSKTLYDHYVNYENGQIGPISGFVVAGPYEIEANTEYQVPSDYDQQFAYSDALMNHIGGRPYPGATHKFTTPANAKYIRLTIPEDLIDTFMLCKSTEFPAVYVPFIVTNSNLRLSSNQVQNLFNDVKNDLGVEYINILDQSKFVLNKYVDYTTGELANNNDFVAAGPYEIKPSIIYQFSDFYDQQGAYYDVKGIYISGFASPNAEHKITTPSNAKYIRVSIPKTQIDTLVLAESELFPDSYVPFGSKIIQGLIVETDSTTQVTEIITSADTSDTSADFTGKNAVQLALDSISNASFKKKYIIRVKGFHKVDKASDVIGYPGYPSMILAKDHVDIIGDSNTVFWCELPFNDADIGPSADGNTYPRTQYQTLYSYAKDCLIKDVTFVVVNARYALHMDNPLGANTTHNFENVFFVSKGSKGSMQALGCGTSSGEEAYFTGGGSHSDGGIPFYCHNNSKFSIPSKMSFNGHAFSSNTSKLIGRIESDGSLVGDKMELIGCSFGGTSYVIEYGELWLKANPTQNYDSFNHAEWQFTGYGNEPFLFDNQVNGYCLRFKTNATGSSNSIRFVKTSSAFSSLIKNNQVNTDVSLYVNSRDYIDGYIVQDGSAGLSAQAWGCKDLTETAAYSDGGVVYTSLGKRLGDCSTAIKTLGVVINGVTNTVTFNKNYTAMSNTAILAEINSQLSGAVADLYIYGRDYYPSMTDVAETVFNSGSSYIPKGSVVAKSQGTVKLANANDKVYGVALDDIPVVTTTSEGLKKGQGRVLKRGYIYANPSKAHYVLADFHTPAIGSRFSVSNGQLVTDANGKISVDIDTGVISINC